MTDKVTTVDESGAVLETTSTSTSVAEFDPIAAGLAQLQSDIDGTTYDIATTKGLDTAKRLRALCVKLRTNAGEVYDSLNRPMLDRQALIRKLKAQFVDGVKLLEDPLDVAIKAQEKIKEEERKARVVAEELRVKALRDKIAVIAGLPAKAVLRDAAGISALDQALAALEVSEALFAEFTAEATELKAFVRAQLSELFVAATGREAEAERVRVATLELEAARAQLAKETEEREAAATLKRETEAREFAAARQREAEDRAERQRVADEAHAAQARLLKDQQDAFEAERKESARIQTEKDAAAAAEHKKLQAQLTALQPKPEPVNVVVAAVAPQPAEVAAAAAPAIRLVTPVAPPPADIPELSLNKRPSDAFLAATLAEALDANISDVIEWLRSFDADAAIAELEAEEFAS